MTAVATILSNTIPVKPAITITAEDLGDFCPCDFRCEFVETVFADASKDGVKNDYTDFLFRKISPSDTITIKLYRYGKLVYTVINNNYGTYYNTFTEQPLYVGWVADWTMIFNAFTGGVYQVKATLTILGEVKTFESRKFRLAKYSPELAHGTVKIETYQNGNIESSEFDYTNLIDGGWYSSVRLKGYFGRYDPTLERDKYFDSSYREIQNRDKVEGEYTLRCERVATSLYTALSKREMLANDVYISSYNLFDDQKYSQYPVVPESFDESSYNEYGFVNFTLKFSDRQKDNIKRNF